MGHGSLPEAQATRESAAGVRASAANGSHGLLRLRDGTAKVARTRPASAGGATARARPPGLGAPGPSRTSRGATTGASTRRHGHADGRPPAGLALDAELAAVGHHQVPDDREPEPGAAE